MAQRTIVRLVDDLDDTEIQSGGKTVRFSFENTQYEIDLSDEHVRELQEALAPYIAKARRVGGGPRRGGGGPARPDSEQLRAIREWGKKHGYKVSDRGRVSRELQEAYHAAH